LKKKSKGQKGENRLPEPKTEFEAQNQDDRVTYPSIRILISMKKIYAFGS
jgi:hypothetical protein